VDHPATIPSSDGRRTHVSTIELTTEPTTEPTTSHAAPGLNPRRLAADAARLGVAADHRSAELSDGRRIPDDLSRAAAEAGLFRQLVGTQFGGTGAPPLDWFRTGLELSRHEASFGWVVTQGAAEMGWIAAGADERWAAEVLSDRLATSASSTAGLGRLAPAGANWRFGGRWSFNTGCQSAGWIGGLALVEGDDGTPTGMRWGWVPADRARIVEDWDPTGLRGTGSHSTVIEEQDVPVEWTFDPMTPTSNERGPHRCLVGNGNWPIATSVAATQLGNARRAIDETRTVVLGKTRRPDMVPLAQLATIQSELVSLEGLWSAAVAGVERALDSMWTQASACERLSVPQRVDLHTANVVADQLSVQIVERACTMSGTAALPSNSVLARCRRDAQALHQHIATGSASIEANAKMTLGLADPHVLV
jgi:alkylation response protein AidB-like acyl-CoA dehydrogenase